MRVMPALALPGGRGGAGPQTVMFWVRRLTFVLYEASAREVSALILARKAVRVLLPAASLGAIPMMAA